MALGMQGRIASFFNRAVSAVASFSQGRPKEPADALSDVLGGLSVDQIRRTYRQNLNRGEYTRPCFAFHEAARVCPIIVDKVSFWTASVSGLDWSIHQTGFDKENEAEKRRAKKQAEVLRAAYDQMDVKAALRHLALAKFYGFSVLVKKGNQLEPLDWWNLLRDGRYGEWYWNGDLRKTSVFKSPGDAKALPMDQMVMREVEDNLLLVALATFFEYDKLNNWWNLNLEQESKRQVLIMAGNGIMDKDAFKAAALDISDGKSGWLEKGGYSGGPTTEVIFPPASRGLGNFDIRAKVLDETLTKALTGGVLSMLTSPGSGTLAGSAHTETLHTIIGAEAAAISAILQDQYDRPILEEAGLLKPDERPLAWFELTNRRIIDPGTIINWAASLATAQYRIDLDELSERTGMKLIEAPTQPTTEAVRDDFDDDGDDLLNYDPSQPRDENGQWSEEGGGGGEAKTPEEIVRRNQSVMKWASASGETSGKIQAQVSREVKKGRSVKDAVARVYRRREMQYRRQLGDDLFDQMKAEGQFSWIKNRSDSISNRAAESVGVPESWLGPVRKMLNDIAEKAPAEITPEYIESTLAEVKNRLPEIFGEMDVDGFADVLESGMGAAAVEGVRDALRKRTKV